MDVPFRSSRFQSFIKGLLFGVPAVLFWLIAKPLLAPVWGSWLLILTFMVRYWLLPFGLAAAAYAVAVGFKGLSRGGGYEQLVAFFFGVLSVFGVAHTIASWGDPSRVFALVIPCLLAASALAVPVLLEEAAKDGFPDASKQIALAVIAFSVAATGAALFFMRLEWLGLIVSLLYVSGAVFLGWRRLVRPNRLARPLGPEPQISPMRGSSRTASAVK